MKTYPWVFVIIGLILMSCHRSASTVVPQEGTAESRGVATLTSSPSGRTMEPIAIDGPAQSVPSDTLVFASTWAAPCPGADPLRQWLLALLDGRPYVRAEDYGHYRALSLALVVPAGHSFDLAVRCSTPLTYPVAKKLSLGTGSATMPVSKESGVTYVAESDGFVAAAGVSKVPGKFLGVQATVNGKRVAISADSGTDVARSPKPAHANLSLPVKAGDSYLVSYFREGGAAADSSVDRTIQFTAVPGLNLGSYESRNFHQEYTAETDGFVLASGYTGSCLRDGWPFQQVDGYMTDAAGAYQRMAVEADYGSWRAGSILFPVLSGQKYKVGVYCPTADVQMSFVPVR